MTLKDELLRVAFWVHFAFGAVLGLFVGFNVWAEPRLALHDSAIAGWTCMIGGPILCGLGLGLAKVKYDWDNFSKRGKNW